MGSILKGKNLLLVEQILFCKSRSLLGREPERRVALLFITDNLAVADLHIPFKIMPPFVKWNAPWAFNRVNMVHYYCLLCFQTWSVPVLEFLA